MSFSTKRGIRTKLDFSKSKPLTEQHHKDTCDVKKIIRSYTKTGQWPTVKQGNYLDLPEPFDFHQAMILVSQAQGSFNALPAEIRQDMHNSPGRFLEFMSDPNNRSKIEEYGFSTDHLPPVEPDSSPEAPEAPPIPQPSETPG